MQIGVKQIETAKLNNIRHILLSEGLPADDIENAPIVFFEAAAENDSSIGCGGLEIYSEEGVLRSVVINQLLRGKGAGRHLVASLIKQAKENNIKRLWLLTQNAENFFIKMGFSHALRTEAPSEIQNCEEFTWSHNNIAHCMSMRI